MKQHEFKPGDAVAWSSHGGTAHGTVKKRLTERTHIKSHVVAASAEEPEYLVETHDGKQAAHKPGALRKA